MTHTAPMREVVVARDRDSVPGLMKRGVAPGSYSLPVFLAVSSPYEGSSLTRYQPSIRFSQLFMICPISSMSLYKWSSPVTSIATHAPAGVIFSNRSG